MADDSLSDLLALELRNGELLPDIRPNLPAIPTTSTHDIEGLRRAISAMKQTMDVREGRVGSVMDKNLTLRDMLDMGALSLNVGAQRITGYNPDSLVSPYGYRDVRPVLSVPPALVGLASAVTFKNIFLTWTQPVYANHAYVEVWRSATDALGAAALIGTSDSKMYTDASGVVGATYYYWVRAVALNNTTTYSAPGPFNAVSGVSATLGTIGSTDLGPLSVESSHLADGSVTATKYADASLALTKFAAGIEPVSVVGTLPTPAGYTGAKTVFLTTDKKLYRYDSGAVAWTKAVDGADIIADSVTAGQIAAGAIGVAELAAGAVRTDKLLVTGRGAALNADPNASDASAWSGSGTGFTIVSDTTVTAGTTALEFPNSPLSGVPIFTAEKIPIDATKNYNLRMSAKLISGTSTIYLTVVFYDSADAVIGSGSGFGWPSFGTYFYYGLTGTAPSGTWTEYQISFGPGETAKIPTGAKKVSVGALPNYANTGVQRLSNIRLEQKSDADLIVDGAIVATKLAANSIAVGTAAIQNGALVNAMIGSLAVDAAKIAALAVTEAKIGDLAVATGKIANLAVTTAKIANLAVDVAQINNLAVTEAKIDSLAVTSAKIGNLAVSSAKIADLAVTTAKIGLLQVTGPLIADTSITTPKITVGAATVASNANYGSIGGTFTSVSSITETNNTVFSMTSTGSPVKNIGTMGVYVNSTSAMNKMVFEMNLRIDSVSTVLGTVEGKPVVQGATSRTTFMLPMVYRHTPSAASHNYGYLLNIYFKDSSGNPVNCTGDWNGACYLTAEENKV